MKNIVKLVLLLALSLPCVGHAQTSSGAGFTIPLSNANLANSAVTVNGQTCTLGSSCTVTAAAETLTGTTLKSTVVNSSLTSVGVLIGLSSVGKIGVTSTDTSNANFASITATDTSACAPANYNSNAYTVLAGPALGGDGNLAVSYNTGAHTAYLCALQPGVAWRAFRLNALTFDFAPANTSAVTIAAATTTILNALTYGGVLLSNSVTGTGSMVLSASPTFTGTLTATTGVFSATVGTGGYTVAALPVAPGTGARAYVTNQLTTCAVTGAALTGGGAVTCPVFYNGTAWVGG